MSLIWAASLAAIGVQGWSEEIQSNQFTWLGGVATHADHGVVAVGNTNGSVSECGDFTSGTNELIRWDWDSMVCFANATGAYAGNLSVTQFDDTRDDSGINNHFTAVDWDTSPSSSGSAVAVGEYLSSS